MPEDLQQPTLRELLDDPMIRLVMASDGVDRTQLRNLFRDLKPVSRQMERDRVDAAAV